MCMTWSVRPYTTTPADGRGSAEPLAAHERSGMRAAAHHARRAVPGPLGELAARELSAHADLGYWGIPDALVSRLARQVLALPALPVPAEPLQPALSSP